MVIVVPVVRRDGGGEESKKWPQYLAASTATIAAFTIGIHGGWPTPSLPKILSNEYNFEITNSEASYITIIALLGDIFGGFFVSFIMNYIGRKRTMLLVALPQIVSFLFIHFSYLNKILLYLARFTGGIGEGAVLTLFPLYIAEISEPSIRGGLSTIFSTSVIFGFFIANLIGSYVTIHTAALIFTIFPILFLVTFTKMPESPYYLIMKHQVENAKESLRFLHHKANVETEFDSLCKDVNRQMMESGNYKDLFKIKSNRRAFYLAIGSRIIQQLTGFSPFMFYAQIFLNQTTDSIQSHVGTFLIQLIEMIMTGMALVFVDRFGRKILAVYSSSACCLLLMTQGIFFTLKDYYDFDLDYLSYLPLVLMILFIIVYALGLGVVVTIVTSEIFSTSIKAKAMSIVNVSFAFAIIFSTKLYQVLSDLYGLAVPFYCFALCTFFGVLFFYFLLPETKGKTLEEIQQELKK